MTKDEREAKRNTRKRRAMCFGWMNWYIDRGRISTLPSCEELRRELRKVSWRRAH